MYDGAAEEAPRGDGVSQIYLRNAAMRAFVQDAHAFGDRWGITPQTGEVAHGVGERVALLWRALDADVRLEPDDRIEARADEILSFCDRLEASGSLSIDVHDSVVRARARVALERGEPLPYRFVALLAGVSEHLVRLRVQEGEMKKAGVGRVRADSARRWLIRREAKR